MKYDFINFRNNPNLHPNSSMKNFLDFMTVIDLYASLTLDQMIEIEVNFQKKVLSDALLELEKGV